MCVVTSVAIGSWAGYHHVNATEAQLRSSGCMGHLPIGELIHYFLLKLWKLLDPLPDQQEWSAFLLASPKHEDGWENETVMQTQDVVKGLHNFWEFSQPLSV